MNIVSTNVNYNFNIFSSNLYDLLKNYSFLQLSTIGYSVLGNPIYAIKLGNGSNKVFYSAAYHANEWITTPVLMKFIEDFCDAYLSDTNIYNYSAKYIYNTTTIYLVPMVNPDGVNLVTGLYSSESSIYKEALRISNNYSSIPFPTGWKANIRGVDLENYQPLLCILIF